MDLECLRRRLEQRLLPLERAAERDAIAAEAREAAVLILLFPGERGPSFFLTLRPGSLSRHGGQISLPGGAVESFDESVWDAAVRETEEELGVPRSDIRPVGRLHALHVSVSGYLVAPFVGWIPQRPSVTPDAREVAAVIEADVADLLAADAVASEIWERRGAQWRITFFRLGGHAVWGATARILADLAERIDANVRWRGPAPGSVDPA